MNTIYMLYLVYSISAGMSFPGGGVAYTVGQTQEYVNDFATLDDCEKAGNKIIEEKVAVVKETIGLITSPLYQSNVDEAIRANAKLPDRFQCVPGYVPVKKDKVSDNSNKNFQHNNTLAPQPAPKPVCGMLGLSFRCGWEKSKLAPCEQLRWMRWMEAQAGRELDFDGKQLAEVAKECLAEFNLTFNMPAKEMVNTKMNVKDK